MVFVVGGSEHFGFVDEIDLHRFEHAGLDKVSDPAFGHDRNCHRAFDFFDHIQIGHAGHAALSANIGRHPLERHHCRGAGVFGDLGLLGVGDIHDDTAFEHFRQTDFDFIVGILGLPHIFQTPA